MLSHEHNMKMAGIITARCGAVLGLGSKTLAPLR